MRFTTPIVDGLVRTKKEGQQGILQTTTCNLEVMILFSDKMLA